MNEFEVPPSFYEQSDFAALEQAVKLDHYSSHIAVGCLITGRELQETSDNTLLSIVQDLSLPIWLTTETIVQEDTLQITRIYLLPWDSLRGTIDRDNSKLEHALALLVRCLDVNASTWAGQFCGTLQLFDPFATGVDQSLFYLFNQLPSPAPSLELFDPVQHGHIYESMKDLLAPVGTFAELKTNLYPYQRHSAALMLQRESIPERLLDPRLEERHGPDGNRYYYNARDGTFFKTATWFDSCQGGILAESMGLGKTLVCLALINATRGHPAKVPVQHQHQNAVQTLQSLRELSIKHVQRHSIPWSIEQRKMEYAGQDFPAHVADTLRRRPATYEIPQPPSRWNRNTVMPPPKRLTIATTTIVVVPRNLTSQWQSEIVKHVGPGTMRVLVMEDIKQPLPDADELRTYDLVLFSRTRFELESKDGSDDAGRRLAPAHIPSICRCPYRGDTRDRDCTCLKAGDLYESPLKQLHFKRIIIDEGHSLSAKNTRVALVANQLVVADCRWIISGTPAKDLMGVELDILDGSVDDVSAQREELLQQRRLYKGADDLNGAAKSLGMLAANFLKVSPWHNNGGEPAASWDDYIYRHEHSRKRTYTCFATSLKRTLQALVIKTQPDDVEDDINLPALHHEVVSIEPSYFDKLTANLFAMTLMTNIITSEREDQDYIFHPRNLKARQELIRNLRQSAFCWTGFSQADVLSTLKNAHKYLTTPELSAGCSDHDRDKLEDVCSFAAQHILRDSGWQALAKSHEVGIFIDQWPEESAEHWNFVSGLEPLLCGLTPLLEAQKHVDARLSDTDPLEGLSGVGVRAIGAAMSDQQEHVPHNSNSAAHFMSGEPQLLHRSRRESASLHHRSSETDILDGTYSKTQMVGSTSAKLSYLVSKILGLHKEEKILVFYDGDNIAYYLAQALDMCKVRHEIYAKSLSAATKSEYLARFSEQEQDRVLLMDVRQAAFGLNITAASRIFFVNPVCRPSVEAQAIKRAHRIGQTRPVFCETLVLEDSIEQKLYQRSKAMSAAEHQQAKSLEDDTDMRRIIESACFVPLDDVENYDVASRIARFHEPQQLWGRRGAEPSFEITTTAAKRKRTARASTTTSKRQPQTRTAPKKPAAKRKKVAIVGPAEPMSPLHISSPPLADDEMNDASVALADGFPQAG